MILELKRLNKTELAIILTALQYFVDSKDKRWSGSISGAKILLEDDAEFVRGLFWTSKEEPPKEDA